MVTPEELEVLKKHFALSGNTDAYLLAQNYEELVRDFNRMRDHSIMLNALMWRLGERFNLIEEGSDVFIASPDAVIDLLFKHLDKLEAQVNENN